MILFLDINECENNIMCFNGGICYNIDGFFVCNCIVEWGGLLCDYCEFIFSICYIRCINIYDIYCMIKKNVFIMNY